MVEALGGEAEPGAACELESSHPLHGAHKALVCAAGDGRCDYSADSVAEAADRLREVRGLNDEDGFADIPSMAAMRMIATYCGRAGLCPAPEDAAAPAEGGGALLAFPGVDVSVLELGSGESGD